jgi:phosphatidylserine/phosphatidylglycerophosphate/cardiolipin synthase-like enzyme
MADLLRSPWDHEFRRLLDVVEDSLVLCAPYVGAEPCQLVMDRIEGRRRSRSVDLRVVTDLSRDNLLSGVTDVASLLLLVKAIPRTTIRFLPNLHAKVYVADQKRAIVTSSNLTSSGMMRNFEYGVSFDDPPTVATVRADILQYSELGSSLDRVQLQRFVQITEDLRELSRTAQRSVSRRLHQEFDRRLEAADFEIFRARTAGKTPHAIFADAIIYLLRNGPLRTVDLHRSIQRIHPDLCDDSVNRVIDG